jgi:hypothetical protein
MCIHSPIYSQSFDVLQVFPPAFYSKTIKKEKQYDCRGSVRSRWRRKTPSCVVAVYWMMAIAPVGWPGLVSLITYERDTVLGGCKAAFTLPS